jgi:hypothetical protein
MLVTPRGGPASCRSLHLDGCDPGLDLDALRRHEAWLRPMVRALVGDDAEDMLQQTWLGPGSGRPAKAAPSARGSAPWPSVSR